MADNLRRSARIHLGFGVTSNLEQHVLNKTPDKPSSKNTKNARSNESLLEDFSMSNNLDPNDDTIVSEKLVDSLGDRTDIFSVESGEDSDPLSRAANKKSKRVKSFDITPGKVTKCRQKSNQDFNIPPDFNNTITISVNGSNKSNKKRSSKASTFQNRISNKARYNRPKAKLCESTNIKQFTNHSFKGCVKEASDNESSTNISSDHSSKTISCKKIRQSKRNTASHTDCSPEEIVNNQTLFKDSSTSHNATVGSKTSVSRRLEDIHSENIPKDATFEITLPSHTKTTRFLSISHNATAGSKRFSVANTLNNSDSDNSNKEINKASNEYANNTFEHIPENKRLSFVSQNMTMRDLESPELIDDTPDLLVSKSNYSVFKNQSKFFSSSSLAAQNTNKNHSKTPITSRSSNLTTLLGNKEQFKSPKNASPTGSIASNVLSPIKNRISSENRSHIEQDGDNFANWVLQQTKAYVSKNPQFIGTNPKGILLSPQICAKGKFNSFHQNSVHRTPHQYNKTPLKEGQYRPTLSSPKTPIHRRVMTPIRQHLKSPAVGQGGVAYSPCHTVQETRIYTPEHYKTHVGKDAAESGHTKNIGITASTERSNGVQGGSDKTPVSLRATRLFTSGVISLPPVFNQDEENDLPDTQPVSSILFEDVVAYVDVRSGNDDITGGVQAVLKSLGATISHKFTKNVTHVVFKEGLMSTYKKAIKWNIPLVSLMWIEESKKNGKVVPEKLFPPYNMEAYESPDPFNKIKRVRRWRLSLEDDTPKKSRRVKEVCVEDKTDLIESNAVCPFATTETMLEKVFGKDWRMNKHANSGLLALKSVTDLEELEEALTKSSSPTSDDENYTPLGIRLFRRIISSDESDKDEAAASKQELTPCVSSSAIIQNADQNNSSDFEKDASSLVNTNTQTLLPVNSDTRNELAHLVIKTKYPLNTITETQLPESSKTCTLKPTKSSNPIPTVSRAQRRLKFGRKKAARATLVKQSIMSETVPRKTRQSSGNFVKVKPKHDKVLKISPTMVFTGFHKKDIETMAAVVIKLGGFELEAKVSSRTTHVVSDGPKRTLNMLRGIARGCWILTQEWIFRSLERGRWLEEEEFEIDDFSSAVKWLLLLPDLSERMFCCRHANEASQCRLEKQCFGPAFKQVLFRPCGPIFVAHGTCPPATDLQDLVKLCGGRVAKSPRGAAIAVGVPVRNEQVACVSENWVLDSIMWNRLKPTKDYTLERRLSSH
uniref:BRCT domain-containing protein n=1 Tax=Timema bartmani TaxID=61472 RepID=A0A7R9EUX4_9NEOP|nr:unnamed protein product [Timema bartmani]